MSPALVDDGAPPAAAPSPQTLPKQTRPPPRNPSGGETLPEVAPSAIPCSADRLWTTTAAMDAEQRRNAGERNLESVFSVLCPSAKDDKAAPSGLSRPRLVKVRRHFASPRVRPGSAVFADSQYVTDRGFTPFRSVSPPAGNASGQIAMEGADHSSSGFAFGRSSNSGAGDRAVSSAKDDSFTFTLGGTGNSGGFNPAMSENAGFVSAAGQSTGFSNNSSYLRSSVAGDEGNGSLGSWSSASEAVPSVDESNFRTGAKSYCIGESLASWVPDGIEQNDDPVGKTKEFEYISQVDQKKTFVFGDGHSVGSSAANSARKPPEVMKRTDTGRGTTLQPGNSKKQGMPCSSRIGKSAGSKLPEEMQKLNINSSKNADNVTNAKAGDRTSEAGDGGTFIFGTNKNISSSFGEGNSMGGVFVFGRSSHECGVTDLNSTDGSDRGSARKLPEEMQKLNIKDSTLKDWSTDTENASLKFTTVGSCSSGAETITNDSIFDFGIMGKCNYFDENMTSRLPDEMRKLNIEVPSGVDGFEKMKGPSFTSEDDPKKFFVFGSNQNIGSSHDSYVSELPEEFKTANTRRGTIHQPENGKKEGVTSSVADPPQVFVFGNNSKNSTLSGQNPVDGFDRSTTSKLPEEMQKLNIRGSENADDNGKAKVENGSLDASGGVFIFGSSNNVSASFGEGSSTAGVFVFGSSSKKNNVPDLNAFDGLHKSSMTDITGASVSGSNKNASRSFGESKLSADGFVFGSSSMQGASFYSGAFGFDQKTFNKLPDEMQELNIRGSGLDKTKGGEHSSSNNAFVSRKGSSASSSVSNSTSGVFVFGSSSNKDTAYNQGMADWFDEGNRLPDEMQKLNVRANDNAEETKSGPSEIGASVSGYNNKIPASCGHEYSTTGIPTVLQFSFHVINQDGRSDVIGVPSAPADHYDRSTSDTNASSCSSSFGSVSQSSGCDPTFAGYQEGPGTPTVDFNTTKRSTSRYSKDSLFSASCQNAAFNVKKGATSHSRLRKKRGKLRDSATHFQRGGEGFTSMGKSFQANSEPDSPEDYSPMDLSPCQLETPAAEECSREASVAAVQSIHLSSHHSSTDMQNSVSVGPRDKDVVNATECLDTKEELLNLESHDGDTKPYAKTGMAAEPSFVEEQVSGLRYKIFPSKMDLPGKNDSGEAGVNTTTDFSSSEFEKQTGDCGSGLIFSSCSNDVSESSFTFVATPSTRDSLSASKHSHRRKFRTKVGRDPFISNSDTKVHFPSAAQLFPDVSTSSQLDSTKAQSEVLSVSQCLEGKRLEINKKPEVRQEDSSTAATRTAAQEACEKWRLRGNQAYANGDLSKAEEYYTRGVNSISSSETSSSCTRALMLCYSNRAATRMSNGRIRDALSDCMMAAAIDPSFLRAQLRAANCHLLLGDIDDACSHFEKCLPKGSELCMDRKFILEASDGLRKAKQVADYVERAVALLQKRTTDDTISVLQIISDALSLSPYSERLIEMKAGALLMLRRYDELIQLCDQTLESAERNCRLCIACGQFNNGDNSLKIQSSPSRSWRCNMKSRAYFCLGKLEEALTLLQEREQVGGTTDRSESKSDSLTLLSTVSELLRLKVAGNAAFKAGRHSEAVEHYTAALAYNIESRPFAAVCFCNRAAAYQALGQITDAISDCSLAIALDPDYPKAISRRATLHEVVRDFGQASSDLRRLVSLLERKLEDLSGGKRTTSNGDDPELARLRLAKVEEKARREIPLDMYMILGIDSSSDAAEIKKAYRKAALRHHPDKAGQFLVRSENTDEGLWKEVASEVHRDADHLFKTIGEAYAVLSDPSKRLQYDTEEEIRTSQKSNSGTSTPRNQPDYHSSHFERGNNRWQSRDNWKSYGNSKQRWSGSYQQTSRYY